MLGINVTNVQSDGKLWQPKDISLHHFAVFFFLSLSLYLYLTRSYLYDLYVYIYTYNIYCIIMHTPYCGRSSHRSPRALHSLFWKDLWAENLAENVYDDWRIASVCRMRSWKMEMYWQQALSVHGFTDSWSCVSKCKHSTIPERKQTHDSLW